MIRGLLVTLLLSSVPRAEERVVTSARHGHLIHNRQVFPPDGRFIYYDSRSEETRLSASTFIGRVDVATGREETIYQIPDPTANGPGTGAVTCNPRDGRLAFIHGLPGSAYAPHRRSGATLGPDGGLIRLDARDLTPPLTPGALAGGTHAHHWSPDGRRISFTYNDARCPIRPAPHDLRTVGIMTPGRPVAVADPAGIDEFSGTAFATVLVPVTPDPDPGSDEILRAFDEDWIDSRRIAFQGIVRTNDGRDITELFLATLPDEPGAALDRPGLPPAPPADVEIRRLTRTHDRKFPGIQGPRHWVRASPDGRWIAYLAKDEQGLAQIHLTTPSGDPPRQLSRLDHPVEGPFDWSPDATHIAACADGRVFLISLADGSARFLTRPSPAGQEPRHGTVFSPDGRLIAFNRSLPHSDGGNFLQICVVESGLPISQPPAAR